MQEQEYITISQYAKIKGISTQAVYKQLQKSLQPFVVMVANKKHLDLSVLSDTERESLREIDNPCNQPIDNQNQPIDNHLQPLLEKQIELLQNQLAEKDKQIESLLQQISGLQEQNSNLTELLRNSQVLLLTEQKKYIEQENPQKEKKGIFGFLKKKNK